MAAENAALWTSCTQGRTAYKRNLCSRKAKAEVCTPALARTASADEGLVHTQNSAPCMGVKHFRAVLPARLAIMRALGYGRLMARRSNPTPAMPKINLPNRKILQGIIAGLSELDPFDLTDRDDDEVGDDSHTPAHELVRAAIEKGAGAQCGENADCRNVAWHLNTGRAWWTDGDLFLVQGDDYLEFLVLAFVLPKDGESNLVEIASFDGVFGPKGILAWAAAMLPQAV